MSDTGSNDPYDPNRPSQPPPGTPPPPPAAPQWGSNPPPAPDQPGQAGGAWTGGQLSGQQFGQPASGQQYGQPAYGQQYGQPAGSPPPNYLIWAIVSTVLCCLPLGIASIVFAAQVNGKYAAGDLAGAQASSEKAKKFAIWSAIAGLVFAALYVVGFVLLAAGSTTSTS